MLKASYSPEEREAPISQRASPTEVGISGGGPSRVPDSKISFRLGAWVFWASMIATIGKPVPAKTTSLSCTSREAAQHIRSARPYSSGVAYLVAIVTSPPSHEHCN